MLIFHHFDTNKKCDVRDICRVRHIFHLSKSCEKSACNYFGIIFFFLYITFLTYNIQNMIQKLLHTDFSQQLP